MSSPPAAGRDFLTFDVLGGLGLALVDGLTTGALLITGAISALAAVLTLVAGALDALGVGAIAGGSFGSVAVGSIACCLCWYTATPAVPRPPTINPRPAASTHR